MKRRLIFTLAAFTALVPCAAWAGTQTYNESWQNRSSLAANDLHREFRITKNVQVKSQNSATFPTRSYSRWSDDADYDIVRFDYSEATVLAGQYGYTCVSFKTPDDEPWVIGGQVKCTWTIEGQDIDSPIPATLPTAEIVWGGEPSFEVQGEFSHWLLDLLDLELGPVTVEGAQWALSDTELSIEELTWDLTSDLSWSHLEDDQGGDLYDGFTLAYAETQAFLIPSQPYGAEAGGGPASVLVRYRPTMDGDPAEEQWGMAQYSLVSPQCPGDLDDDGMIGITDFLTLLANWGPCQP